MEDRAPSFDNEDADDDACPSGDEGAGGVDDSSARVDDDDGGVSADVPEVAGTRRRDAELREILDLCTVNGKVVLELIAISVRAGL